MENNKQNNQRAGEAGSKEQAARGKEYLDHGVESLVAMDNPDDSQLGAEHATTERLKP